MFTAIILGIMAVGAIIGFGIDQAQKAEARDRQLMQEYNQALSTFNELENQVAQTELDIQQTEANISAFDQALGRWQGEFDASLTSLQLEGQAQYDTLMENWQGTELAMAQSGRVGGSAALVAQQQKAQLEVLAGRDLKLDMQGGTFGSALSSFYLDSLAGLNELTGNRDIAAESLGIYEDALVDYQTQLKEQAKLVEDYRFQLGIGYDSNGTLAGAAKDSLEYQRRKNAI